MLSSLEKAAGSRGFLSYRLKGVTVKPSNVTRPLDKAIRRQLYNFGSFVRQTARRSLRKRKKSSEEGKPPSMHEGTIKRKLIYAVDELNKNVVIGPTLWSRKAAHIVEHGGDFVVNLIPWWVLTDPRERVALKRRLNRAGNSGLERRFRVKRRIKYKARPFMRPAFEKEITSAKLKNWFQDIL